MLTRRQFSIVSIHLAATAALSPLAHARDRSVALRKQIDKTLTAAADYLTAKQHPDGAWCSEVYGPLKDGPSLTALIAATLKHIQSAPAQQCFDKATAYLAALADAAGSINPGPIGITYPVYAAAGAVIALNNSADHKHALAHDAWLVYLCNLQLTDQHGWQPEHPAYGGWSYASSPPSPIEGKPPTPLAVPNLSATVFALAALRASGCTSDDLAITAARTFVERCQNWHDDPAQRDAKFDDGGFFFILDDPIRNKAGEAGIDATGRTRYTSYGSTTADGLRALLACGCAPDHPRVTAARDWLVKHFDADEHPGHYAAHRAHARPAIYYYYAASAAQALSDSELPNNWANDLATAILSRQQADGSWSNPIVDTREDDPLVATPLAMRALIHCRTALTGTG